jgi:quinolinate synthase
MAEVEREKVLVAACWKATFVLGANADAEAKKAVEIMVTSFIVVTVVADCLRILN